MIISVSSLITRFVKFNKVYILDPGMVVHTTIPALGILKQEE